MPPPPTKPKQKRKPPSPKLRGDDGKGAEDVEPPIPPPNVTTITNNQTNESDPTYDVFISYNPSNSWAQCCCIALELRKIGIKVWFDMATDVSKGGSVQVFILNQLKLKLKTLYFHILHLSTFKYRL